MPRLLLVRHCAAAATEDTSTRALSELGLAQAGALSSFLQKSWAAVDWIRSSPYQRAIDTIAPFATARGLEIGEDVRLQERSHPYYATPSEHIAATEAAFADPSQRIGQSETALEAQTRGWLAVERALASEHELPLLVTHGQLLSLTLARLDGSNGIEIWREMTTPDVFLLETTDNGGHRYERVWQA
jgi:2,3-bisphosphoglycerate-dependent phosphoglycerate mutase